MIKNNNMCCPDSGQNSDSKVPFSTRCTHSHFVLKSRSSKFRKYGILIKLTATKEQHKTHSAAVGTKLPDSDVRKSQTKIASPKLTRDLESGIIMTLLIDSVWPMNTFHHTSKYRQNYWHMLLSQP